VLTQPPSRPHAQPSGLGGRGVALLVPESAVRVRLEPGRKAAAHLQQELATSAAGTVVAATATAPGARGRLRRALKQAGVEITHEYVLLPSLDAPVLIVEDSAAALRWIWRHFVTVPPGVTRKAGPLHLAILLARRLPPRAYGALIPGRLTVGRVAG
jgi:hypothetical protein